MAGGQLSARLLNASYGPQLQEINRACPIVSGLTFWFDRGDDFFRWPELVYDRFFYVGVFAGGDLVGYCMAGLTRAWTGEDLGWLAVLGDARVLPEHRGLGWIDVALEKLAEVVPRSVTLGLFIIKEGNRAADHLRSRFRLEGYDVHPAGRLTVQNLLLMRRRRRVPGVAVTTATPADLDSLVRFLAGTVVRSALRPRHVTPGAGELDPAAGTRVGAHLPRTTRRGDRRRPRRLGHGRLPRDAGRLVLGGSHHRQGRPCGRADGPARGGAAAGARRGVPVADDHQPGGQGQRPPRPAGAAQRREQ